MPLAGLFKPQGSDSFFKLKIPCSNLTKKNQENYLGDIVKKAGSIPDMDQRHFVECQGNQLLNFMIIKLLTAFKTDEHIDVIMNIRFMWVWFELAKNALFETYCLEHGNVHTALMCRLAGDHFHSETHRICAAYTNSPQRVLVGAHSPWLLEG